MMLKVAAYCRVSTDEDDQRNSLESQRRYFQEYIGRHPDWESVGVYADEGISGTTTKKRREFNEMIACAERGEIDMILTKEVSRFARNTVDTLNITRRLKAIGVGVIFLVDNIDTRENDGEFRLTIMASVAQEESRKTSERVRWGQKRQMERGVVFGNDSIFGFTLKDGKLTVKPAEAEVVRHVFHKFAIEGKGTHVIARELHEEGIPPPKTAKGVWSSTMILRLLRNEKYAGDLLQKKYVTRDFLSHKKTLNDGSEETIYIRDHHEPIIDRELFERVQAELARRAPSAEQKTRYSNRHWCSGKIRCGACGSRFILRQNRRPNGDVYKTWACHAQAHYGRWKKRADGGVAGCNMRMVNDKTLSTCVLYVLEQLRIDTEGIARHLAELLQGLNGEDREAAALMEWKTQRERLQKKQEAALDAFLAGIMTREELERMQIKYRAELETLSGKIEQAERRQENAQAARADFDALIESLTKQAITSPEVWRELIEKITVHDDRLTIKLYAVPQAFALRYTTSGRGEKYKTNILTCEMEDCYENKESH